MRTTRAVVACASIGIFALLLTPTEGQRRFSALPTRVDAPADNLPTPDKVRLGRLLFWDPILSGDRNVACATCHHPDFGYSDGLDLSIGINGRGLGGDRRFSRPVQGPFAKRNSQTILNVAFNGIDESGRMHPSTAPMFWDLRARSLETQALEPIKAFEEMRGNVYTEAHAVDAVVRRLDEIPEYGTLFAKAFPERPSVTASNLAKALAAFQRTLVSVNAPFDRYMRGDRTAMTALQVSGMERFERAGCANCHNGPMFSDFKSHVLGVPNNGKLTEADTGVASTHAFRTPSLRNVSLTGPYMHSGVFTTLNDVVRFYNRRGGRGRRGGRNLDVSREQLDPLLRQVRVRGGRNEIVAFLEALTDENFDRAVPTRVPSGLSVGGTITR